MHTINLIDMQMIDRIHTYIIDITRMHIIDVIHKQMIDMMCTNTICATKEILCNSSSYMDSRNQVGPFYLLLPST